MAPTNIILPPERPILFSADMVRAILDGRKTQTRRIIKNLPAGVARIWHDGAEWNVENANGDMWLGSLRCPYGQPGDRLWVRETWAVSKCWDKVPAKDMLDGQYPGKIRYKADDIADENRGRWRPSIHMPRSAARITLEVTEVRAQRLQDITEADAIAEGVEAVDSFRTLWEKINGPGSWDANPWVWAVTFNRI